jgi:hypothetical protein
MWAQEGEEFVLERSKDGLNPISLGEEGDPAGAPMLLALDCMPGDQTLAIGDLRNGAPPTGFGWCIESPCPSHRAHGDSIHHQKRMHTVARWRRRRG